MTHLWEVDHAYYCNEGNFYSNDTVAAFASWPEFVEAGETESDPDLNLLFRWDWELDTYDGPIPTTTTTGVTRWSCSGWASARACTARPACRSVVPTSPRFVSGSRHAGSTYGPSGNQ